MNETTKIIDPHLHFFDYENGHYHWLKPENPPIWPNKDALQKSFSAADLTLSDAMELQGLVHIEAGFDNQHPEKELDFLEQLQLPPFKAIACADLTKVEFNQSLETLRTYKSFVGVRHIIDAQGDTLLHDPNFADNLALLAEHKLIFEAQLDCCDLDSAIRLAELASNYPNLQICINHSGILRDFSQWPALSEYAKWRAAMHYFSDQENIALKISGMEMQNPRWSWGHARWLVHKLRNLYAEERLMLASNFPINLLAMPYDTLWLGYRDELGLSPESFQALGHDNAKRIYRL
ncbi:amidohydrolase [Thalassotalea litorea]|uniref:Amidohydrolase n=1 Tax=Thalassotalea litorea TaxID=2020715 RepID=A0A5R9INR4_9GAMM|nr:amidohydrolase family protein [Thalassotalea litorea]TLU67184.1 amidohydrolase [Thalassotalea litorea]